MQRGSASGLHVYGMYRNASNFERMGLGWDAADNHFVLRNENAGTGQQRGIGFSIGSAIRSRAEDIRRLSRPSNKVFKPAVVRGYPTSSLQVSRFFLTNAMNWSATAPSMRR
jgi:hypothetical protein